jgi:hypothetical protein
MQITDRSRDSSALRADSRATAQRRCRRPVLAAPTGRARPKIMVMSLLRFLRPGLPNPRRRHRAAGRCRGRQPVSDGAGSIYSPCPAGRRQAAAPHQGGASQAEPRSGECSRPASTLARRAPHPVPPCASPPRQPRPATALTLRAASRQVQLFPHPKYPANMITDHGEGQQVPEFTLQFISDYSLVRALRPCTFTNVPRPAGQ